MKIGSGIYVKIQFMILTRIISDNSNVRKLGYENLKIIKCTLHL